MLLFVGFGLLMVYSASSALSDAHFGSRTVYFRSQLTKAAIGLGLLFVLARIDYRLWQRLAKPLLWGSVALLAALVIPAVVCAVFFGNGAVTVAAPPGRPLKVSVDGKEVASLEPGEHHRLNVEQGSHELEQAAFAKPN